MKPFFLNTIRTIALLSTIAVTFTACNEDFVNVESDIRGVQDFITNSKLFPFTAYNKKIEGVQTNSLPNNLLGVYDDPNYGATAASIVAQVVPDLLDPDFGDNPEIISVKLYIPYFSTLTGTDTDGSNTYELDSIFGNLDQEYSLSIYRNKFFLRDLDPETNFEQDQVYYSNSYSASNASIFEDQLLYSNTNFKPSPEEIAITTIDDTTEEEAIDLRVPGIYIDLNNQETGNQNTAIVPVDFWEDLIVNNQDETVFSSSIEFRNFFRGFVIKAESVSNQGSMSMVNLNNAQLLIEYKNDEEGSETDPITYALSFNGITFNAFENLSNFPVLMDGNQTDGDDQLFLKGLEGSMTVLDLFDGTVLDQNGDPQDALQFFKDQNGKWLLNEVDLVFYVNDSAVEDPTIVNPTGEIITSEPDRLVLFDLENNIPIIDYFFDQTQDFEDPCNSLIIHAPKLERDADGKGIKYKFRLTQHLNSILSGDRENSKLGLYVSTNVNLTETSNIEGTDEDDTLNSVPQTSVIAPRGTVLYGNTTSVPEGFRASLEIFYTESQN